MPTAAHRKGMAACRALFFKPKEQSACEVGVEAGVAACMKEAGVKLSGRSVGSVMLGRVVKSGSSLGFFQPCDEPCPDGTERVTLTKFTGRSRQVKRFEKTGRGKAAYEGDPAICVCRLDPKTRKKFRDETVSITRAYERGLKPFGSEKKPIHLRRCYEVDERGRCTRRGEPLVVSKPRS